VKGLTLLKEEKELWDPFFVLNFKELPMYDLNDGNALSTGSKKYMIPVRVLKIANGTWVLVLTSNDQFV
jgi:hypothetical protein